MDFLGLDGDRYKIKENGNKNPSKLYLKALEIIKEEFPFVHICEEVSIKIDKFTTLRLDILMPSIALVVEIDGKQHDEYVSHFHDDKISFAQSQGRDSQKEAWCDINKFKIIRLKWNQTEDEWRTIIRGAVR